MLRYDAGMAHSKHHLLFTRQHSAVADLSPEDHADVLAIISAIHTITDDEMAVLAICRVLKRVRQRAGTERQYVHHREKVALLTGAMSRN
jgi:hypothetical protein